MRWSFWTLFGFSIWLIISPWVLGFSDLNLPRWNVVFVGAIALFLSSWNLFASDKREE